MVFDASVDISGQTGDIGLIQIAPPIMFSQIFNGSPQYYPGSIVQVQELMSIRLMVVDGAQIGTSFEWFSPKKRLGTYQIIDPVGIPYSGDGLDGYITSTLTKISKKSWYTITANPNTLVAKHEQISLDTCNAYLQPEVYLFPGINEPIAGFRFRDLNPAFLGSISLSKAPLADTAFNQIINGVGIKLKPGVEGIAVDYKVAVVNDIYTDYPSVEPPSCIFLQPGCQTQFSAFLASSPDVFETQAACEAVYPPGVDDGYSCYPSVWVCPGDPSTTFPYYLKGFTGGGN